MDRTIALFAALSILLGGCAIPTKGSKLYVYGFDRDEPDSLIGKSRVSVMRDVRPPDAYFVNDTDGTTFFVYETDTSREVFNLGLALLLLPGIGGGGGGTGPDLNLIYTKRRYVCVLLRFGPDERLLDHALRNRSEDDHCTDKFASRLAGTRKLPTDVVMDELKRELRTQSSRGDIGAAKDLAVTFDEFGPLEEFGADGDSATAYEIHQAAMNRPENGAIAWKWLCISAERGNVRARQEAAWWHTSNLWERYGDEGLKWARVAGLGPDNRVAYMWYTVAASDGDKQALGFRDLVVEGMTDDQVIEAEQMVQNWRPGQCP